MNNPRLLVDVLKDVASGKETVELALVEIGKEWEASIGKAYEDGYQDGIDMMNRNDDE